MHQRWQPFADKVLNLLQILAHLFEGIELLLHYIALLPDLREDIDLSLQPFYYIVSHLLSIPHLVTLPVQPVLQPRLNPLDPDFESVPFPCDLTHQPIQPDDIVGVAIIDLKHLGLKLLSLGEDHLLELSVPALPRVDRGIQLRDLSLRVPIELPELATGGL